MVATSKLEFSMLCEFRNPPGWERPFRTRYYDAIDHIVWAEEIGYDCIYFTEHHFADDDYLTAPLMNAAIVADRTKRIKIGTCVLLLPLYHPVRLAEEGAFIDQLSEGRFELGFGTGYMAKEYAGYSIDWKTRGKRTDEMVEIIRRLWTEEEVTFLGEHFQIEKARLRPKPLQSPCPPIWVGGSSGKALERAARFGDGWIPYFSVPTNDPTVAASSITSYEQYAGMIARIHEMRAELGKTGPFSISTGSPFRPKTTTPEDAERLLECAHQLHLHGATSMWTPLPAPSRAAFIENVAWYGEEVVAKFGKATG